MLLALTVANGSPNVGWLRASNISTRNCSRSAPSYGTIVDGEICERVLGVRTPEGVHRLRPEALNGGINKPMDT